MGTSGNLVVIISFVMMGLFAVGGFAIDTSLYLLKRQQVQSLSESIAMAAALSLPSRVAAKQAAHQWYEALRNDNERELLPSIEQAPDILTVTFDDNSSSANKTIAYLVKSITVNITVNYKPKTFPLPGFSDAISITGQASAQMQPTDIFLLIENTASFFEKAPLKGSDPFLRHYRGVKGSDDIASIFSGQCFSEAFLNFKQGILNLYDNLSQLETFRVGVMTTTSRTGEPFILADLGETSIKGSDLEFSEDQAEYHSSRCALGTSYQPFAVPKNPNSKGNIWTPKTNLTQLLGNPGSNSLDIPAEATLLTREAIWLIQAGYSSASGFIHPRYYYSDPTEAIQIASDILQNSRRDDGLPVSRRLILVITDDAGTKLDGILPTKSTLPEFCMSVNNTSHINKGLKNSNGIKLGILYFGHNTTLPFHDYRHGTSSGLAVNNMRNKCLVPGASNHGIFFSETSPEAGHSQEDFKYISTPLVAHAIKQAELRK